MFAHYWSHPFNQQIFWLCDPTRISLRCPFMCFFNVLLFSFMLFICINLALIRYFLINQWWNCAALISVPCSVCFFFVPSSLCIFFFLFHRRRRFLTRFFFCQRLVCKCFAIYISAFTFLLSCCSLLGCFMKDFSTYGIFLLFFFCSSYFIILGLGIFIF